MGYPFIYYEFRVSGFKLRGVWLPIVVHYDIFGISSIGGGGGGLGV